MGVGFGGKEKMEKMASRMVESGRLSSAARVSGGESKVADITEETLAALGVKTPCWRNLPLRSDDRANTRLGPQPRRHPNRARIVQNRRRSRYLRLDCPPPATCFSLPRIPRIPHPPHRVGQRGTAPGRSMLCTSRLTPLAKADGGIRPIACGELIYRLITKTLLRKAFKPDFLEEYQLGVSSKGGVEPIVRTIERASPARSTRGILI